MKKFLFLFAVAAVNLASPAAEAGSVLELRHLLVR